MAKGDREKVNRALKDERNTANQQYGSFLNTVNQSMQYSIPKSQEERNFIGSGYQSVFESPIDPTVVQNIRGLYRKQSSVWDSPGGGSGGESSGGGGGGGGYTPPPDPFSSSRSAFANLIASGGVDIGAMKEALPGLRKLAESGGYSPEQRAELQKYISALGGIGETGGYDPGTLDKINRSIDVLRNIGETGGYSPEVLSRLQGDIGGFREFAQTGGVSPEALQRMRGAGVLDEFALTGGFSPTDIANIRARATSVIPSLYSRDLAEIQRSNALLGAAAPNYAASLARLNRNRGISLAEAARDAELGIAEQIRSNRLAGAQALSNAELGAQNLITGRRLAGLQGAFEGEQSLQQAIIANKMAGSEATASQLQNLQNAITNFKLQGNEAAAARLSQMADSIAKNQLAALGGITSTQQGAEQIAQQGKIAGAQGMFGVESAQEQARLQAEAIAAQERAAAEAAAAYERAQRAADEQFWAQFAAGNEQWIGGTGLEGKLGALGGYTQLHGTTPGAQALDYNAALGAMGGRSQAVIPTLEIQQKNVAPPWWQTALGIGGSIAGAFIPSTPKLPSNPLPGGGMTTLPRLPVPFSTGYRP